MRARWRVVPQLLTKNACCLLAAMMIEKLTLCDEKIVVCITITITLFVLQVLLCENCGYVKKKMSLAHWCENEREGWENVLMIFCLDFTSNFAYMRKKITFTHTWETYKFLNMESKYRSNEIDTKLKNKIEITVQDTKCSKKKCHVRCIMKKNVKWLF